MLTQAASPNWVKVW